MSERSLIGSMMASREAYDAVASRVEEGDLSEQGMVILRGLTAFYDRDSEADQCDPELLARDIARGLSNPKHKEMFQSLIGGIASDPVSPANVVHDYIAVKREAVGFKLASVLSSGRGVDVIEPLMSEYSDWLSASTLDEEEGEAVMQGQSVAELVSSNYEEGALIEVWPPALNAKLDGGCLPGHHIVVFARPEMGKTLFLINAIAGFLHQGRRVLYIGNEDPLQDVVMRAVSRLSGMTKHEVLADPDAADAAARSNGYNNLVLASLTPGTPREIEKLMLTYKPQVLVIDQLRNLNVGEDHFVQKLEKAATTARNLGKKNGALVVSVTQAGDSASGKAVLDMGDVDSSNTGIPAQADVMIGIGATKDDEAMGRRVLSLCKNKRSGLHDCVPVNIDPHTSSMGG